MLTSADIATLRDAAESTMEDTGQVVAPVSAQGTTGELVAGYDFDDVDDVLCGFSPKGGRVTLGTDGSPVFSDAALRLPAGTDVGYLWHFRLSTRRGETVTDPVEYEVCAPPAVGVAATVCQLQVVTP